MMEFSEAFPQVKAQFHGGIFDGIFTFANSAVFHDNSMVELCFDLGL